jgi:hypothetical protein
MIAVAILGLLLGGFVEHRRLRARWDRFFYLSMEHSSAASNFWQEAARWHEFALAVEADARGEEWLGAGPMYLRGFRTELKELTTKAEDSPARRLEIAAEARAFSRAIERKALEEDIKANVLQARW